MKQIILTAGFFVLMSCDDTKTTETKLYDGDNQLNLIVEHRDGPPLSRAEDKLYIVENGERKLIFEGYGGSSLKVPQLKTGVLVVAYCGGTIRNTSSFLNKSKPTGELIAVKVQPVISSSIQVNGKSFC